MHAADRNTNCVQHNKTRGQECAVPSELETAHSHNDRKWSASVRTPSRDRNSKHECRDPNTTLQHETRHADERARDSSTLEAARSHENADMGVSGLCHKTMNNTRPKWQNPDTTPPQKGRHLASLMRDTKNKTETWQHKNLTTQRLTHNNRPDKNNQTQRQRGAGGREGRKPSQCQQGSSACPGRDGRVEPGRLTQSRDPGKEPGRSRRDGPWGIRPNRNPGGWPWRDEPGRIRPNRIPGKQPGWSRRDGPGRIRPNRNPGGWPGRGRRDRPGRL